MHCAPRVGLACSFDPQRHSETDWSQKHFFGLIGLSLGPLFLFIRNGTADEVLVHPCSPLASSRRSSMSHSCARTTRSESYATATLPLFHSYCLERTRQEFDLPTMPSPVDFPSNPDLPAYQRSACAKSLPSPPAGYSSLMICEYEGTMEESLHITLLSSPLTRPLALQHIGSWSSISGHRSGSLEADHVTSTVLKTCRGQGAYHRGYSAGVAGSGGGAVGLAVLG